MKKPVGQTKDVGFQFGIRRTFTISKEKAWQYLFSENGLYTWLGQLTSEFELNQEFQTKEGIIGYVRVFKPNSHIRINWKRKNWKNLSTVQIRVIGNEQKTTISIHQEKLHDPQQREEMKVYWGKIMDELSETIKEVTN